MEVYATKTIGVGGSIKASVDDFIVEETLVDSSKACVSGVVPSKVLGSTSQRQRYLLCILVKRNWDTFIAIKNIAKSLGIDQGRVQFAGIKDAKAVTAQYITIENVLAEDVDRVDVRGVHVYPVGYVRDMLSLFYLLGNNFTITLKNLTVSQSVVETQIKQTAHALDSIGGIPNFFGHQRFGTIRPITHLVGKSLMQGKFEEAAMLFLAKPSIYEHPESRKARQELQETGDYKRASEIFPKQLRFEKLMLNYLAENPLDFVGAFQRLPPKLQALFVQAHQSYLFNRFLSGRIKRGVPLDMAEEGDFVVSIERSGLPLTAVEKLVTPQNSCQINEFLKAGRMRVALPIFGVKQKLSSGIMGDMERNILTEEGIEMENLQFNVLSRISGRGSLRAVIAPVRNFKLQSTENGDSVVLDFMLLRGCYATVYLRELMKPPDILSAGF
jgi:tRNA pseudouridine13 synthase